MNSLILLSIFFMCLNSFSQPIKSLNGDERSVRTVSFSPDGSFLISGEGNRFNKSGCICTWDVKTWKLLKKTEVDYAAQVGFSTDGNLLACMSYTEKAFGNFNVWDFPSMSKKWTHNFDYDDYDNIVPTFSFSPSNDNIVFMKETIKSKIKSVIIVYYNIKTSTATEDTVFHENTKDNDLTGYKIIQYTPDGKFIVFNAYKDNIYVWGTENKKVIYKMREQKEFASQVIVVSPKSNIIAACNYAGENWINLWDLNTGQSIITLKGHKEMIMGLAFSPDGSYLASCGRDSKVKIWNVETGKLIFTLNDHTDDVNSVCFSPDGKYLASASSDETVKIWDAVNLTSSESK